MDDVSFDVRGSRLPLVVLGSVLIAIVGGAWWISSINSQVRNSVHDIEVQQLDSKQAWAMLNAMNERLTIVIAQAMRSSSDITSLQTSLTALQTSVLSGPNGLYLINERLARIETRLDELRESHHANNNNPLTMHRDDGSPQATLTYRDRNP